MHWDEKVVKLSMKVKQYLFFTFEILQNIK